MTPTKEIWKTISGTAGTEEFLDPSMYGPNWATNTTDWPQGLESMNRKISNLEKYVSSKLEIVIR
jgi:hypothetical protein